MSGRISFGSFMRLSSGEELNVRVPVGSGKGYVASVTGWPRKVS